MQKVFVGHACAQVKCAGKGKGEGEGRNGTRRGEERKERERRKKGAGRSEEKGEGDQAVDGKMDEQISKTHKRTNKSVMHDVV